VGIPDTIGFARLRETLAGELLKPGAPLDLLGRALG
jgi:hypothetical protein